MVFKSHTGVVMANVFHDMLERFGLQEKVKHFLISYIPICLVLNIST
jgi:hypothetical protein